VYLAFLDIANAWVTLTCRDFCEVFLSDTFVALLLVFRIVDTCTQTSGFILNCKVYAAVTGGEVAVSLALSV
jgi:hypothetical protein